MTFFLTGLVVGLSIAAPVGPIGVLCIRRTLAVGRATGFVSGLGAATADALYGAAAAFGLTAITRVLVGGHLWLRLAGGIFLLYLGIQAWRTATVTPTAPTLPTRGPGLGAVYASTLALTLTNPMTILSFAGIFAGLGVASGVRYAQAAAAVAGVFCGSTLWWLILSTAIGLVRDRVATGNLQWINRGSGVIIAGFGVFALLSVL